MQPHHSPSYLEFPVINIDQSKAFYSEAFAWGFTDYGPDYAGIVVDGKEVGGLAQTDDFAKGGVLVVLYSNDLEASLEAVQAAGGPIAKPIFAFPGGRRFHFLDPSGHELAVWTDEAS